ncbi:MAG: CehA/McbA family metallohydrolase [Myxococcota bacterium]|nr:CehA/McbA family metallohydrolase [Myxococcota bacterium]
MRGSPAAVLVAAVMAATVGSAEPMLLAERIDSANFAERRIGGPDAIGGVGDWYLANDVVEIIVDDPSRRHGKLGHGGTIVDAGVRGRDGDDQFARLFPIVNLDQRVFLGFDAVRAEVDPQGRYARLLIEGRGGMSSLPRGGTLARFFDPLVPETDAIARVLAEVEYLVRPGEPFVRVTTRLRNEGDDEAPIFAYGDVWMRGGRSLRSFEGDTLAPERSAGFRHSGFDADDVIGSLGEAFSAFTFVAAPGIQGFPRITYALFSPERTQRGLRSFGVTGTHVSVINAFPFEPPWERVGVIRMLLSTREALPSGAEWVYERRLVVVDGGDVAAATDVIFPLLGVTRDGSGVELRVEPEGTRAVVHVERAGDSAPVTQLESGWGRGPARARLPPGEYVLDVRTPHRAPERLVVSVEPGRVTQRTVRIEAPGFLRFGPAFADGGGGRVIIEGLGDTPDPVFRAELLGFRVAGKPSHSATETRELHFVGNGHDPERVAVAPGRYRLTATRGLLHELGQVEVDVPASGAEARVPPFALRQVVELRGIVSADFHVHAQASDDSQMSNEERLKSYVAESLDVMISTDHDHVADFAPALAALDLGDRIRVRTGVEITSSAPSSAAPWTIGHHNAWPVVHRPEQHRQGAPRSQDLRVADLYAMLRRDYGVGVVQLNHALAADGEVENGRYLSHLGGAGESYDPALPIDERPNRLLLEPGADRETRAIDFDAMEIMNGRSFGQYLALREAWYSLLRQGFRRTGTGNSDTHGPNEVAAYPRNFVYVGEGAWSDDDLDAAVRAGRLFATSGPLIAAFQVNGARMGDLAAAPDGRLEVRLAVAAPDWVPVEEVRLLVNGEPVRTWRDLDHDRVLRISITETLRLSRDGFVTLEAGAPLETERRAWARERGGLYSRLIAPGFVSQAVSNPVFVDVDGDGRSSPPQLRPRASATTLLIAASVVLLLLVVWRRLGARAGQPRGVRTM